MAIISPQGRAVTGRRTPYTTSLRRYPYYRFGRESTMPQGLPPELEAFPWLKDPKGLETLEQMRGELGYPAYKKKPLSTAYPIGMDPPDVPEGFKGSTKGTPVGPFADAAEHGQKGEPVKGAIDLAKGIIGFSPVGMFGNVVKGIGKGLKGVGEAMFGFDDVPSTDLGFGTTAEADASMSPGLSVPEANAMLGFPESDLAALDMGDVLGEGIGGVGDGDSGIGDIGGLGIGGIGDIGGLGIGGVDD